MDWNVAVKQISSQGCTDLQFQQNTQTSPLLNEMSFAIVTITVLLWVSSSQADYNFDTNLMGTGG